MIRARLLPSQLHYIKSEDALINNLPEAEAFGRCRHIQCLSLPPAPCPIDWSEQLSAESYPCHSRAR